MSAAVGLAVALAVTASAHSHGPSTPMEPTAAIYLLVVLGIAFMVGVVAVPFRNRQWTARWEMWFIWFIIALAAQFSLTGLVVLVGVATGNMT